jgi:ribosomal protein L14E/L6E/L27E
MKKTATDRYYPGRLVISKQGRDKGHVYVIISSSEQAVYVADGVKRPVGFPKKKNPRHLQVVNRRLGPEAIGDEEIIQAIEAYEKRKESQEDV